MTHTADPSNITVVVAEAATSLLAVPAGEGFLAPQSLAATVAAGGREVAAEAPGQLPVAA